MWLPHGEKSCETLTLNSKSKEIIAPSIVKRRTETMAPMTSICGLVDKEIVDANKQVRDPNLVTRKPL